MAVRIERMTDEQRRMLNAICGDLSYEPETGIFRWAKNGRGRTKRVGEGAGSPHSNGYVRIKTGGKTYFAHRLAWLFSLGAWPDNEIDHINGDRKDNRLCNLRQATTAQNRHNTCGSPSRRKYSSSKGVTRDGNRWIASIAANGQTHRLGRFSSEAEAAEAYRAAAKIHHGEFASW